MKKVRLITLAAVFLAAGALSPARAAVVLEGSSVWTSTHSGQTINVDYEVDHIGALYYYNYQVEVPAGGEIIQSIEVDAKATTFATVSVGSVADIPHGPSLAVGVTPNIGVAGSLNVNWLFLSAVHAGTESQVIAYTSPLPPIFGNGSALDDGAGPWSSQNPGSQLVPVPVPEPTTMIAGALLLLPFGASTLRIVRKNRTV